MSTTIRIIETEWPIGMRQFDDFIFCLPPHTKEQLTELFQRMKYAETPFGVYQFGYDEAGVFVYYDDDRPRAGAPVSSTTAKLKFLGDMVALINDVLGADLVLTPDSLYFIPRYCHVVSPDTTTHAQALELPGFALPYMEEASDTSA